MRSKGWDGSTPVGELIPADEIDPAELSLRTLVNGEVVQDADATELIFPLARLVSDLSHAMTLEPGDIVLAGTPAGSRPVGPGDEIEVVLAARLACAVEGGRRRPPAAARGATSRCHATHCGHRPTAVTVPRPVELTDAARAALLQVGTATLTASCSSRHPRGLSWAGCSRRARICGCSATRTHCATSHYAKINSIASTPA